MVSYFRIAPLAAFCLLAWAGLQTSTADPGVASTEQVASLRGSVEERLLLRDDGGGVVGRVVDLANMTSEDHASTGRSLSDIVTCAAEGKWFCSHGMQHRCCYSSGKLTPCISIHCLKGCIQDACRSRR
eukprot:TRINITY_DN91901_c0_g1_i1.p1 TRINITY_DN91901_c0_g1~~TRINITY_DN91901_c0_g1_i1.p1  ORF type:complete len:129 (+),score=22.66 TRINITY_DN91901_c0_g1_i1:153-539(+)